ncbi:16S rRNA (cytosine(1402)-N(4))-methyltransferase RsmH [Campylobacter sp. VicNov18]|uniref:16S rRNA (cytosine(1402)-N(4))-methyltransferase RsmH n=1 Tax=Campylobacter bilis TaxID=2691918 RepID=UPI0013298AA9|nr:16S rRNA (cytosine(1402)-N(4))-methyltransferase RsmH [Campylobacter bilis]MPV63474.1 16S rRNA (cytosine(1402)-N(4))-methyltransferase RsmH [Campylobacter hepaticus]MBM0636973.1 16S rRNA (cytosine(1402)-N(4))-methyltransferase RsmH [Campylobacter bilis]MCC8277685.1 16S rRNA (cytosine(1402)-N(4))-methyltransferase RsmH [Campylobacter bilis]MCC8299294.1 16S rRNA (cytosine(1402)-N(4))-methyltransferase RsmH [Campylobacter bilis]MCC8300594.1 16S rRNA (cytosine(1402)-N(4))-methyltransferase RsmH
MEIPHTPVLLHEVQEVFKSLKTGYFLDCTLGFAGHSKALLMKHPHMQFIACDQDTQALEFSKKHLEYFGNRITFIQSNFSEILEKIPSKENLKGILADIGVSSFQLDNNLRGFSLKSDFLDMRMDQNAKISAFDVVNTYTKEQLAFIFKEYGQLHNGSFLAEKICLARNKASIKSGKELYQIIGKSKQNHRKVSQATLVFQAIRIEVNQELKVLENFLQSLENLRLKDCILAIISFHSLEDKIVKNFFKKWAKNCICDERTMRCTCTKNHSLGKIISKKAISATKEELLKNPRSSCAKMRVFHFKTWDKVC